MPVITKLLPLGDQDTQEINEPGGKVDVSNLEPSALTRNMAKAPFVKTTASISGTTGFQAISCKNRESKNKINLIKFRILTILLAF